MSLTVPAGEVLALVGPSGCGKSSLLRAIAGLEPLADGTVRWNGVDLGNTPVHRREFGLMFQDGQLFEHRDVAGNVDFGLRSWGAWNGAAGLGPGEARAARRNRVTQMLDLVGLAGFERRSVSSLSGGQRQRVALARSLAPAPRLLLLDEPLSSLDRVLREELVAMIASVLRESKTTALYVTHDHAEAFAVADQVAVMMDGHVRQVATPSVLLTSPVDEEVARFLGTEFTDAEVATILGVADEAQRDT